LVFREKTTSKAIKAATDEKTSKMMFRKLIDMALTFYNIADPRFVLNMDETSVSYDFPRKTTLEVKGRKEIEIKTIGREKDNVTAIFTTSASGEKLAPFVVIRGKRRQNKIPSHITIPKGMEVVSQKSAWTDTNVMMLWIQKVLKPWKDLQERGIKCLLLLDEAPAHMNDDIKLALTVENVIPVFIPASTTAFLQPMDLSVNRSIKAKLRSKWEEWIKSGSAKPTISGKLFKRDYDGLLSRVMDSWTELQPEVISSGWKESGIMPLMSHDATDRTLMPEFLQWLS
jgi:hypothetical protein